MTKTHLSPKAKGKRSLRSTRRASPTPSLGAIGPLISPRDTEEDHRTELGPAATHSPYPPGVIVADGISEVPQAFIEAKQAHETWMAEWGELDNWPRMFDSLFQMACADNRIRKWAKDLRTTRDIMEKILTSLQDSMPPYNPMAWDQLRSLFVTYSDLHRTIVRAQTIVEVHLYEVESVQRTSY